jgi:ACR3 family arsenite efflux pump ArsB
MTLNEFKASLLLLGATISRPHRSNWNSVYTVHIYNISCPNNMVLIVYITEYPTHSLIKVSNKKCGSNVANAYNLVLETVNNND